jgi:alkylhydroperoxidase family enzyme
MHTRDLLVDLTIATGLMNACNRMAISLRNSLQAALQKRLAG